MKRIEQIAPLTEEMLSKLAKLVSCRSERGEAVPGCPFGEGPAEALAAALEMGREMGFRTVNLDNYCGYIEMGEGPDIIGIAAHLDVVPAGEGWNTDPYTMTRVDDTVYGRGVSDDKGAAVASLYAMKLVRDSGIALNKRVRLLLGCNEESGSLCMKHYKEVEEPITIGFTPDGYFPGIYGEKGGCGMALYSKNTRILDMEGGFVFNAVCPHCTTRIPAGSVSVSRLREVLASTPLKDFSVTEEDDVITIEAQGVSAHASTPLLGVNAASYTMYALQKAGFRDDFVDFYMDRIGTHCDGEGLGLKVSDAYGDLTLNNGIVMRRDGTFCCTIDIRYPITYTPDQIRELAAPYLEDERGRVEIGHVGDPLFYDPESALVQGLYRAYREVTGDQTLKPMVIGGGTYAKSLPGIIAFGCEFPDADNHIHDANELMTIQDFQTQTAVYVQAILNLLEV
ncbi:MAG: Sapep family Mn(2+)-dependent dipeptidase [Firmicutes bacterium]|nr:Sapep family Mn(2+)-dependent dipeptidase [Bacillota bacterium]